MAGKKTPKWILEMMEAQQRTMRHIDEVLWSKANRPEESQPQWLRKPVEYWIGLADGTNNMLEEAMHRYGCYAGFQNQARVPEVTEHGEYYRHITTAHVDYADWRRVYYQRG